jgi:hypothetical protein
MDASKVIIKIIKNGEKKYITNIQPNSFSYQSSKNPFNDPEVIKFEPSEALKIAEKLNSSFYGLSVVDINGKNIYHRYDKINEIINEEFQNFLSESSVFKDERLHFSSFVDADFYNYQYFSSDYEADINRTKIMISWSVNLWVNRYGIESFNVEIDKVEGIYVLNLYDKQSDELVQETEKNVSEIQWNFQIENVSIALSSGLYVNELDFDFKNQICRVSF